MWKCLQLFILKKLYRILVVKVYTVDKSTMPSYYKYRTFCDLAFNTNQGRFSFSFKQDSRSAHRDAATVRHTVVSYLVELEGPNTEINLDSPLYKKVIVVVMVRIKRINYEALARVLLDLYIDQFPVLRK